MEANTGPRGGPLITDARILDGPAADWTRR